MPLSSVLPPAALAPAKVLSAPQFTVNSEALPTEITANLPTPTIIDGSEHFNTVLYSGNGSSQTVTGFGFNPDVVWHKGRSVAYSHSLVDVLRGNSNVLFSNLTAAEQNPGAQLDLATDGATVTYRAANLANNQSSATYVIWGWKAGGTAVSNTAGSITSQVSANTDAGFSIVSWVHSSTTSTIGHGLTTAPNLIILKSRTTAYNWDVGSDDIGWGNRINLNSTAAAYSPAFWNSTAPTSSVFTYAGSGATNGDNMIAYCFANTDTTKAGSYVANQSTNGTFIYLGFRPAFFLAKNISRSQEWIMMNNKTTDPYNPQDGSIQPNSSAAEGTGNEVDFLSNGVKLRNSGGGLNYASGDTFIYLAFAENPFKYANAR